MNGSLYFNEMHVADLDRDDRPPVPGGDADLISKLVDAVGGTAPVAASNYEGALHVGQGVVDHFHMKAVPSAHNIAWVERTIGYQSIDQLALAEGAHNDTVLAQPVGAAHDLWLFARVSLDIRAEGARRVR